MTTHSLRLPRVGLGSAAWAVAVSALLTCPLWGQAPQPEKNADQQSDQAPKQETPANPKAEAPAEPQGEAPAKAADDAEEPEPVEVEPLALGPQGPARPVFNRWLVKIRYDEAAAFGRGAYGAEKAQQAIEAYRVLEELYPNSPYSMEAAWQICTLAGRLGEPVQQMAYYAAFTDTYPDGDYAAEAFWGLISHQYRAQAYEEAMQGYRAYIEMYPTSPNCDDAIYNIASYLRREKDEEGAVAAYQELVKRYPTSTYGDDCWYQMGYIYQQAHEYDLGTQAFRELMVRYPYSDYLDDAAYQIVNMSLYERSPEEALALIEEFLNTFPSSTYARYVRRSIYYQQNRLRQQGKIPRRVQDPTEDLLIEPYKQLSNLRNEASKLKYVNKYADAIPINAQIVAQFPDSDYVDNALYDMAACYEALEKYHTRAKEAATPEAIADVRRDWAEATRTFQIDPGVAPETQLPDALSCYLLLAYRLPSSDLRDTALYKAGQALEQMEQPLAAVAAYLELITTYPQSGYAYSAVSRVSALKPKIKSKADQVTVYEAIASAFPEHSLSDDFLFELGMIGLEHNDLRAAQAYFERYVSLYPSRQQAADALLMLARIHESNGAFASAKQAYRGIMSTYPTSGYADDAELMVFLMEQDLLKPALAEAGEAIARCEAAATQPLAGYDAVISEYTTIVVPVRQMLNVRAYNLPRELDIAYQSARQWTGLQPHEGKRIVLFVNRDAKSSTPGNPSQLAVTDIGEPPNWRLCAQYVVREFLLDPALSPLVAASPTLADGFAELAAVQLEHGLYEHLGEVSLGGNLYRNHLRGISSLRSAAATALNGHAKGKVTCDKLPPQAALGIAFSLADRTTPVKESVVHCGGLHPLFAAAAAVPAHARQETDLPMRAGLMTHVLNQGLQANMLPTTQGWRYPADAEVMKDVALLLEKPEEYQKVIAERKQAAAEKAAAEKAAAEKAAAEKAAAEKAAAEKAAAEKAAAEKAAAEKAAAEKAAAEKAAAEKAAAEKAAAEKAAAEKKPPPQKPAEEKPAEEKPAEEKPAEEKPAEEKPAEEKPAEEKPAEEKPAEEKPAEEKPAEEKPPAQKPPEEK